MKFIAVILVVALFSNASRAEEEEEVHEDMVLVDTEEANEMSEFALTEGQLEAYGAELGIPLQGINPTAIALPHGWSGGPVWECIPRRLYQRDCNLCRCNRNRRLICTQRNCDGIFNLDNL